MIVEATMTTLTALTALTILLIPLINEVTQHTKKTPPLVLGINAWLNGGTLDPREVRINLLDDEVDDVIHRYVGQLGVTLANIFVLDTVLEHLV